VGWNVAAARAHRSLIRQAGCAECSEKALISAAAPEFRAVRKRVARKNRRRAS
jgi:hypothetical protein